MYGWFDGINKERNEEGSRWVRHCLISTTRCGSCALENVKEHMGWSSMFLVVSQRFPWSIPQLMQARIPGLEGLRIWLASECNWKFMSHNFVLVGQGGEESGEQWRKAWVSPGYTAELINRHSSINNRPPSCSWKLLSLAKSCSVMAPLSTSDLLHNASCLPRMRKKN